MGYWMTFLLALAEEVDPGAVHFGEMAIEVQPDFLPVRWSMVSVKA
jgi:hypothetical protein